MAEPKPSRPAPRPPKASKRVKIGLAVGALIFGVLAIAFTTISASRNEDVRSKLADDQFEAGQTATLAAQIQSGGPVFYPDPLEEGRGVFIIHDGMSADEGWDAISSIPPNTSGADCILEWSADVESFLDSCNGAEFTPRSPELIHYPTNVDNGVLIVDMS